MSIDKSVLKFIKKLFVRFVLIHCRFLCCFYNNRLMILLCNVCVYKTDFRSSCLLM